MSKTDKVANIWRRDRAKAAREKVDAILAEKDVIVDVDVISEYRRYLRDIEDSLRTLGKAIEQLEALRFSGFSEEDPGGPQSRALHLMRWITRAFRESARHAQRGADFTSMQRHAIHAIAVSRNLSMIEGLQEIVSEMIIPELKDCASWKNAQSDKLLESQGKWTTSTPAKEDA